MQLFHGHLRRHGAQGVDELAFHQSLELIGIHGLEAQGLGGVGNGILGGFHAHVEFGHDVHAHAVTGDQGLLVSPLDLQPQGVHVDRDGVVQHRQHQGPAVENHLLPAKAGAHEGDLLGGAAVQPGQNHADDDHGDQNHAGDDKDVHQVEHIEKISHGEDLLLVCPYDGCGLLESGLSVRAPNTADGLRMAVKVAPCWLTRRTAVPCGNTSSS